MSESRVLSLLEHSSTFPKETVKLGAHGIGDGDNWAIRDNEVAVGAVEVY